jgi:hypothetical protein
MKNVTQWDVVKYGQLIEQNDMKHGKSCITTKLFIYKNQLYMELWNNDCRMHFGEALN